MGKIWARKVENRGEVERRKVEVGLAVNVCQCMNVKHFSDVGDHVCSVTQFMAVGDLLALVFCRPYVIKGLCFALLFTY